ncbi:QWRF motif protein (DUF566) [Tasmannia lanceolata]|uniref:QWRF motif protein (DUF566) n=1 Tax=Tasmannia lanceolata TaxID=3420 RepID=UPI0040646F0A
MENSRRSFSAGVTRSPRLQRSRSGAPSICHLSIPEPHPLSGQNSNTNRSKSITKTVGKKEDENQNPILQESITKKDGHHRSFRKPQENREKLAGVLHRNRISDAPKTDEIMTKGKRSRSVPGSPSAWALSPGRSLKPPELSVVIEKRKQKSGGMSGVFRFFRQQKMPEREETFHQFRILQTRYMQWRFVNARGECTIHRQKRIGEKKLFNTWLVVSQLCNSVVEKRIQVQKLGQEVKLIHILNSQIHFLHEWEKIDKKSSEAVGKSARILRAASITVPLVEGAKADIFSVYGTFCAAMDAMNAIEANISRFFFQAEKMSSLVTELVKTITLEREGLEELMKTTAMVASMEAEEKSLRVHLIQAMKDRAKLSPIPLYNHVKGTI